MSARRVASGIIVSRALGVVREQVLAHYFGVGRLMDAWGVATRIPGALQNLLGEGTLSASFVPVYVRLLEQGREKDAARLARSVFGLLAASAGGLALAGHVAAPWLAAAVAPGFDDATARILAALLELFFPMAGVLILSAWTLGVLNSHGRFFTAYVAPALWNASIIVTGVTFGAWGWFDLDLMMAVAWGAVAGGVVQFGFQLPFAWRHLRGASRRARGRLSETRVVVSNFLPAVAARGGGSISSLIEMGLASLLLPGAVGMLRYASTLYFVPIAVFALSITAAALPALSRDRVDGLEAVRKRTEQAVRTSLFGLVGAAVAFLAFREETMAFYERGEFGADAVSAAGWVLAAYAVGLPASGVSRVLAASFHSLGDTRTPARIVLLAIGIAPLLGVGLMFPFDNMLVGPYGLGAAGLALGSGLARWIELGLFRARLARRLGGLSLFGADAARVLASSAVGAAAGFGAKAVVASASAPLVLGAYVTGCVVAAEALGCSPLRLGDRLRVALARHRGRRK